MKPVIATTDPNQRFKADSGNTLVLHREKVKAGRVCWQGEDFRFCFFFWRGGSEGVNIIDYLKKAHTIKVQYYASINKTTEQSNEVETQRETEGRCSLSTWWRVRLDCPGCSSYSSSMRHWIATHSRLLIDLAPSDTVFFSKLKAHLLGRNFENNDQIICAVEELLEDKGATFICDGMAIPHHRLKKCVDVKGEYIEI